jgi:hypothetical protein
LCFLTFRSRKSSCYRARGERIVPGAGLSGRRFEYTKRRPNALLVFQSPIAGFGGNSATNTLPSAIVGLAVHFVQKLYGEANLQRDAETQP